MLIPVQAPQLPPQVSGPHLLLPHNGAQVLTHRFNCTSHCVPWPHTPQLPPQPSPPQVLPLQLGAHWQVPVAEQYCVGLHAPQLPPQPLSPQTLAPHFGTHGQIPQSCGQLVHVSPFCGSQLRLPQLGCGQQSLLQFWQVSPASQLPLPHRIGQTPQSNGQLLQDSLASHLALPQTLGQMPQSAGQVEQVSPLAGAH